MSNVRRNFGDILRSHIVRYPAMQIADAVKLCYQAAFGGGHLITDPNAALVWLSRERASIDTYDETAPFSEAIGYGMARLNLRAAPARQYTDTGILRIFAASAAETAARSDNAARFEEAISALTASADAGETPFSAEALKDYLTDYRAHGIRAVHHTAAYNDAYHPAYRVVSARYAHLLDIVAIVDRLLASDSDAPVTVAIDGRAASGKSTLCGMLASLYDCNVFHMDDFFLPVSMRTEARLSQPGGNVHYERFQTDILDNIKKGQPFSYCPYDCARDGFGDPVAVTPKRLNLIEGSYPLPPYFGDHYDCRVAVTCSPETQVARIRKRNGAQMLSMFVSRWIPMEEQYFDTFSVFRNPNHHIINNEEDFFQ